MAPKSEAQFHPRNFEARFDFDPLAVTIKIPAGVPNLSREERTKLYAKTLVAGKFFTEIQTETGPERQYRVWQHGMRQYYVARVEEPPAPQARSVHIPPLTHNDIVDVCGEAGVDLPGWFLTGFISKGIDVTNLQRRHRRIMWFKMTPPEQLAYLKRAKPESIESDLSAEDTLSVVSTEQLAASISDLTSLVLALTDPGRTSLRSEAAHYSLCMSSFGTIPGFVPEYYEM